MVVTKGKRAPTARKGETWRQRSSLGSVDIRKFKRGQPTNTVTIPTRRAGAALDSRRVFGSSPPSYVQHRSDDAIGKHREAT